VDSHERTELTSQAEYAGSIPVIGSTLTWAYSLFGSPGTAGGPVTVPYN